MDRVAVIFGGRSTEHAISLISAEAVINAIDRSKHQIVMIGITLEGEWKLYNGPIELISSGKWEEQAVDLPIDRLPDVADFCFPVLHGVTGEDGTIQGLFEMMDMPYAGCGVLGSALAMDKVAAKMVFKANGIPTPDFKLVRSSDVKEHAGWEAVLCENHLDYPMFVKPANAGSSVGISKVRNRDELIDGLYEAARYDSRIIVEHGIDAREVETGVIGNEVPHVSVVGEIRATHEFYDFEAKYSDNAGTQIIIPANLKEKHVDEIKEIAANTYRALDLAGFARIDFLLEHGTGKVLVNEVNTIPGFTKYSMFPMLWKQAGVSFTELTERIMEYGYERYNAKNNR